MRLLVAFLALSPLTALATNPPATQSQSQEQYQQARQDQGQSQGASAALSIKDQLQIPYTPAPTAPAIYASNPCAVGSSKALTLPIFGKSSGKTEIDSECSFRELVRVTASVDPCLARKLLATHPAIAAIAPEPVICTASSEIERLDKKIGTAF